jgi:hypothetical protein
MTGISVDFFQAARRRGMRNRDQWDQPGNHDWIDSSIWWQSTLYEAKDETGRCLLLFNKALLMQS